MVNSAQKFAFLSFLDLISCAFGAAVLIFIVSAASEQSAGSAKPSEMLFIYVKPVLEGSQELDFEVVDPDGIQRLTSQPLLKRWRRFAAPAESGGGSCIVINDPKAGKWRFRVFWTDGQIQKSDINKFQVEIFCPDGTPEQRAISVISLQKGERFTKEVYFTIGSSIQ